MISFSQFDTGVENLDGQARIVRGVVGIGLIAFVMTTPDAPLGWYAVLPLLAIVPIFSAITGWDLLKHLLRHAGFSRRALNLSAAVRWMLGAVGVAMIGSVYAAAYLDITLGLLTVLPILGIYPVFAAIAGMDPITALYNLDRDWLNGERTEPQTAQRAIQPSTFNVIHGSRTKATGEEQKQDSQKQGPQKQGSQKQGSQKQGSQKHRTKAA